MFEVHTMLAFGGGENTWSITDENGNALPEIFKSIDEAQKEINIFLQEVNDEIKHGEREEENGYDADDYRIYDMKKKEYIA